MVEVKAGNNVQQKLGMQEQGNFVLTECGKWEFAVMTPSSPTLLAEIIATRKTTFMERREREQEARG